MASDRVFFDYDPSENWDEHLERLSRQRGEVARKDDEELKKEVWACKVGDYLEQTAPLDLWDRDDEAATIYPSDKQVYRVDELIGRCFYLELVAGSGAQVVGIWNADVPKYFKPVAPPAPEPRTSTDI